MLVLVKQVGANYGVLDTDDGALDWVSKTELLDFSKQVNIVGVNPSGKLEPTSATITPDKCNWSKGQNIFKTIANLQMNRHFEFILSTEACKKYRGTIIIGSTLYFKFNANILVPICEQNKSLIAQLDFGSNSNSEVFNALIANFKRGVV